MTFIRVSTSLQCDISEYHHLTWYTFCVANLTLYFHVLKWFYGLLDTCLCQGENVCVVHIVWASEHALRTGEWKEQARLVSFRPNLDGTLPLRICGEICQCNLRLGRFFSQVPTGKRAHLYLRQCVRVYHVGLNVLSYTSPVSNLSAGVVKTHVRILKS